MRALFPHGIPWRSRALWQPVGYGLTAAWMVAILAITREDVHHPLFNLLFAVPLGGWIIGMTVGRLANRLWPPRPQPRKGPDRRADPHRKT